MSRKIIRTEDYLPLAELFRSSGLETEDTPAEGTFAMWRCEDETGQLLGAATLKFLNGCYVLDNLAVEESLRYGGIGVQLMETVIKEAKNRGAEEIWGCAKVPEYYLDKGWEKVAPEDSPAISHCQTCGQYQVSCFPCIIKKHL